MHLPKNLRFNRKEKEINFLKPWTIHMICIDSFVKTLDNGMFFWTAKPNFVTGEEGKSLLQNPTYLESPSFMMEDISIMYVPVVSFDGYNVMMVENFDDEDIEELSLKLPNHAYPCVADVYGSDTEKIHAFGLDQVKLLKLTVNGLEQFQKACITLERYDLLIKYRTFIEEWCDGDLKSVK